MGQAYIGRLDREGFSAQQVAKALEWLRWERWIPQNARVFIKPNLTWPEHIPGVTTTPTAIEAVVEALGKRTPNITIGESDGGYHSFLAEEAFRGHSIYEIAERHNAQVVNLSKGKAKTFTTEVVGKQIEVTLPSLLLHEIDVFITLPVPKVHVMTGVTLGFKNQWGVHPSTMRMHEHPQFDQKIVAMNRILEPKVIFDGTYFLDGAGPMSGEAVRMDLIIAADDIGAADLVCCIVMGIDPRKIGHLRVAAKDGLLPESIDLVDLNQSPNDYVKRKFASHRAFLDYISLIGFHNRAIMWLFWESQLAKPLHNLLFAVRKNPHIERFLYGEAGSPPDPSGYGGEPAK